MKFSSVQGLERPKCKPLNLLTCGLLLWMGVSTAMAQSTDIGAKHRGSDASADRGIFFNRAETVGEGKTTFTAYELVFAGVTHAWSDDAQATVNFLLPITKDVPLFLLSNAKFVISRTQTLTFAIQGEFSYQAKDEVSGGAFGGAALLDLHLSPRFSVHGQVGINTVWANAKVEDPTDGEESDFGFDAGNAGLFRIVGGASFKASENLHLNAEVVLPGGYTNDEFTLVEEATLIFYGVRFAGSGLSADLGFARPLVEDPGPLVMGIPWLSFTARF